MCLRSLCKSCEAAAFDPTVNICSRRAYPTRAARRGPARLQEHTPSEKGKVRCSRRGAANRKHYCGCSVTLEGFVILDGLTKHWLHGRRRRISGASRTLKGIAGALTIESLTVRFPQGVAALGSLGRPQRVQERKYRSIPQPAGAEPVHEDDVAPRSE